MVLSHGCGLGITANQGPRLQTTVGLTTEGVTTYAEIKTFSLVPKL